MNHQMRVRRINKFFQDKWIPSFLSHYYDECKSRGLEINEDFYEIAFEKLMKKYRSLLNGTGQ